MRDIVEIGIGREARRTYRLSDISLSPARRTRSSQDVDTSWQFDAYGFDVPVLSHPTDALADPAFVTEMSRLGGLGVINAEGLWGRHEDFSAAIEKVIAAARAAEAGAGSASVAPGVGSTCGVGGPQTAGRVAAAGRRSTEPTRVLQELHAAPLDTGLLADRIREVRATGATTAVRVSPQHARALADTVVRAGAEILVVQGTIVSAQHVSRDGEPLDLKDFIGDLDVPVIAGSVSDYTTALHLMRTGAAGIIVGSTAATNGAALGIESGMATAIADVAAARRDYLDETGGRYVHLVAAGELSTSGAVAKAIACGADAVMLDSLLAPAREAAGGGYFWPASAAHPRFPRGLIDRVWEGDPANTERPTLEALLQGPSRDALGGENIVGGLRRAMAKCGYTDLKSFQKVGLTVAH